MNDEAQAELNDRKPQWVQCEDCGHKWIGYYMPIEVSKLGRIVLGMCCPVCAAGSDAIYMHMGDLMQQASEQEAVRD